MSVIPIDLRRMPAKQKRFWRKIGERLDALLAYPAKHAISEQEMRQVDEDIQRCRQLMFEKPRQKRRVKLARVTVAHEVRTQEK
jgi:hypothetical protein